MNTTKNLSVVIALDPGKSGGIAVNVLGVVDCRPMPATEGDLLALLRGIRDAALKSGMAPVCFLERVGGYVGRQQPGSAMFNFGRHFGFTLGLLQALEIEVVLVTPQVWQKGFGLGTRSACASDSEWKNKLKAEAQRRYPQLPVTLATADALLILNWALRAGGMCRVPGDMNSTPHPVPLPSRGGEGDGTRTSQRDVPTTTISESQGALPKNKTTKQTEQ